MKACPGQSSEPRNFAQDLALLRTTIGGAVRLLDQHDPAGALVLVKAARYRLGLIDERMAGPKRTALHKALLTASLQLARLPLERAGLAAWLKAFERTVAPQLARQERQSLYDPQTLDHWLAGRR